MNLINFIKEFPDEASCRTRFKQYRDQVGVTCKKCGSKEHYWQQTIERYQCKQCGARTTLRSGTVMQSSNLPFRYWFIAIHLVTCCKKPFSALELQRQLGHKNYEPIWYMLQKIRKTMGIRDSQYQLDKVVELDEGFFTSVDTDSEKKGVNEKKKRGRGSQSKSTVLVMASTSYDTTPSKKNQKPSRLHYIKMNVLDGLSSKEMNAQIDANVDQESVVKTDKLSSYNSVNKHTWCHFAQVVKPKDAGKVLPWVHITIANAKRNLLGTYHMVSMKYIQDYLDEFCYKVNRRYFKDNMFDRLMIACASVNYKNYVTNTR